MFNEIILEHFRNPRNAGELAGANAHSGSHNPVCGDVLRLSGNYEWRAESRKSVQNPGMRRRDCVEFRADRNAGREIAASTPAPSLRRPFRMRWAVSRRRRFMRRNLCVDGLRRCCANLRLPSASAPRIGVGAFLLHPRCPSALRIVSGSFRFRITPSSSVGTSAIVVRVRPDHLPRADVGRGGEKFVVQARAENHRMAAPAADTWAARSLSAPESNSSISRATSCGGNQRMIDGAEQQPFGFVGRQAANRGLNGGKLALLPILIHHDNCRDPDSSSARMFSASAPSTTRTMPTRGWCVASIRCSTKVFPAVGKQRLRRAHAAGFAGGKNGGGEHSSRASRRCEDSDFGKFHGFVRRFAELRRTAISSAVMLMAISSGVSAPMSRPTGACTRSNSRGE